MSKPTIFIAISLSLILSALANGQQVRSTDRAELSVLNGTKLDTHIYAVEADGRAGLRVDSSRPGAITFLMARIPGDQDDGAVVFAHGYTNRDGSFQKLTSIPDHFLGGEIECYALVLRPGQGWLRSNFVYIKFVAPGELPANDVAGEVQASADASMN
jgi:hypothetical protein